jgi:hypothetical protein
MLNLVDPAKMGGMLQLFGLRVVAITAGDAQRMTERRQKKNLVFGWQRLQPVRLNFVFHYLDSSVARQFWPTAGMLLKLDGKPERMVLIRGRLVSVSSKVHGKLRISIGVGAVLGIKRQADDVVAAGPLRFEADINLAQRPITAVFHEGGGYGDRLGLNLVQGGNDSFGLRDCVFVGGIVSSTDIETDAISAFAKPISRMM